jgi:YidC/Oxa1 family membrane protein insertase
VAEYKNPNQQGAPDSRLTYIIMLTVVTFLALQWYQRQHNPQTASPQTPTQSQSHGLGTPAPLPTVATTVAGQTVQVPVVGQAVQTTTVENELYKITFSNRGADVTSWILKKYKDSYGKPLDLVHTQAAETFGYPLSLYTYDAGLTADLAKALYVPSATGNLTAPAKLTFKYVAGEYTITKTFSFDDTYVLHADATVLRNGSPIRALLAWPGGFGDQETAVSYGSAQVDYDLNGHEKHQGAKDVVGGATMDRGFNWAGVSDLYFAAIFLPEQPGDSTITTLHNELIVSKADRRNGLGGGTAIPQGQREPGKDEIKVPLLGAAAGDLSGHDQVMLFVGPKAVDVLRNVHAADKNVTLEPLLDFGFFGFVGKYLFLALRLLHEDVSKNWGWDIIWLTVAINLVILPLRVKTMQSALKMQRIQPQIAAIKAKYKNPKMNDPKMAEMNAEIMQFQKDNGVNMFGGCIPTLIQMPLLFAFFGMLPKVVELRQAHFAWLPDLSAADPWHILPIFMALSMFLVQFYTPSPGVDPQQQRMMAFMMPAFSFMMTWKYASGLALYWSVGNIISIATQAVMNRTSIGKEMREIAEKRARRKAGLGVSGNRAGTPKTIQGKTVKR